jgi:hypothetical protein
MNVNLWSIFGAAALLACSGGSVASQTPTPGTDAGPAVPSGCTVQPPNVALQYCGAATDQLLVCSAPPPNCQRAVPADTYCCRGPAVDADAGTVRNPEENPYGIAYPTGDIGTRAATWRGMMRATPGQRIRNFKFPGYPNASDTTALTTVALSDFYDPEQKLTPQRVKLVHIHAATLWDGASKAEAAAVAKQMMLREQGIVWITAILEGATPGTDAQPADLLSWIQRFSQPHVIVLDSGGNNLGVFFSAAAVPWNAWIDARTMELMDHGVGAPIDIKADIDDALAKFNANPPRP